MVRQPDLVRRSIVAIVTTGSALSVAGAASSLELACRPLPEAIDLLRAQGAQVAYSEGLVSHEMLVRGEPTASDPVSILAQIVEPYGLTLETLGDSTLGDNTSDGKTVAIVPGPELDAEEIDRLRRLAGPVLRRESSIEVLPELLTAEDRGNALVELDFPGSDGEAWRAGIGSASRFLIVRLGAPSGDVAEARYRLKQLIVEAGAQAPRLRIAVEGAAEVVATLIDAELAPYVDGYLIEDGPPPSSDPTGRPWWRARLAGSTLTGRLVEGARRGVALAILEDAELTADQHAYLDVLRSLRAGLLATQPPVLSDGEVEGSFFLAPDTGRYYAAIEAAPGRAERLAFQIEPMREVRLHYPAGAEAVTELYGTTVSLQLDGSSRHWLFELIPGARPPRAGQMLVEGEVLVDPYEVVVQNQIFQERERLKVLSLDVMEYATIVPHWRGGQRRLWEHRILQRRGWLDEYLHLALWENGVHVPRNKLYKGILSRPIDRIELEPLTVEQRKTYRYEYLGQDTIDGHPTWKIGFEPVVEGRLVSGVVWIDRHTGAHRRIRTRHRALGVGVLSGEFTTDFGWLADGDQCYWNWSLRRGTEVVDYLDFHGSYTIEYRREDFRYNLPDMEEEVRSHHDSDVLIHVATPPDGHRWLLRDEKLKAKRGDQTYRGIGVLREKDPPPCPEDECDDPEPVASAPVMEASASSEVLAGIFAFPSRSRVSLGVVSGTGGTETRELIGFNYLDFDFLNRGRRGKGELYLWIGGFDDDGLISLTDPALGSSQWSLTTSFDLRFDPEEDFLFGQVEPEAPGDESSFRNLSLDNQRTSLRVSLSRPLSGVWTARFSYGLHALEFDRRRSTDQAFVLPRDTAEHQLGLELARSRKRLELTWGVHGGVREQWEAWGLDARQRPQNTFWRTELRLQGAHPLAASQSLGFSVGVFAGWDLDRFSRLRLFQVDARVPGYSSSIGFDRGSHAALSYNFRIWKLPLRIRFDAASIETDATSFEPALEQDLLGTQLNLDLHGPWETDLLFGVGRGLYAEPDRGREETTYWLIVSRRFGRG